MKAISAEEFKKRYGTAGLAAFQQQPQKEGFFGGKQDIKDSFNQGVGQIKQGLTRFAQSDNPLSGAEGLWQVGAGAVGAGFSPLSPVMKPIVRPISKAVNYTTDKISDNPAVQRLANSNAGQTISRVAEDVNNLNTITGAVVGTKAFTNLGSKVGSATANAARGGVNTATELAQKGYQATKGVTQGARDVVSMTADSVKRLPSRVATNVAEKQAVRETINALPTRTAQRAAQDGLDIADVQHVYKIPASQKASLQKLAEVTKNFAAGKTKTNPIEVVGKPIVNRIKELERVKGQVGQKLGQVADTLGTVTTREVYPKVFDALKKVNGLSGLTVNRKGILNFENTVLTTAETAGDRAAIQSVFNSAIKGGSGKSKHLLRQELFEVLGGKKKALANLTDTQEKAYNAVRQGLSDVLEGKNTLYKDLSNQYRKAAQPLQEMRGYMKKVVGADDDILDMSAGLLARRLTSAAKSNPEIRQVLNMMDKATSVAGKTKLSVESLQDFYNILEKYYDIAPKTGFQAQIKQGVEKATGIGDYAMRKLQGLAGETPAVRQKALESILDEVFGGKKGMLQKLKDSYKNSPLSGEGGFIRIRKDPSTIKDPSVDTGSSYFNRLNKYETEALKKAAEANKADKLRKANAK